MLSTREKMQEIFKKSALSLSKFAKILGKDRRTILSWLENKDKKELDKESKQKICDFFRYPLKIWDSDDEDFRKILNGLCHEEIRIIDEGYVGGLKYIYENENEGSLILHPSFPNPAYRDFIVPSVYQNIDSEEAKYYRKKRGEKMRSYSFVASEWYSIKSLLEFCFSPIGNFYTREQKLSILELILHTFRDNLNKSLYFFDSYSLKIYGLDIFYLSINVKENFLFFKAPLEMLLVEIRNSSLVYKLHHHYTNAKTCPNHVDPKEACFILELLFECLDKKLDLLKSYELIEKKTPYARLFKKSLSLELLS